MKLKTVEIDLGDNSYKINIGNKFLSEQLFSEFLENQEVLLVYDKNISKSAVEEIETILKPLSTEFQAIGLEASEEKKSQLSIDTIHDLLIEKGYSRQCILIGLGGGIICDLCGFAAATYQRGVNFVLIPTSLLAQVDASVGGKTAVNHPKGKNMIGSFHQPIRVLIDSSFLSTLPEREIKSGMVEMIKHGIIKDEDYFNWLEENIKKINKLEEPIMCEAIKRSVEIKSNIVSQDEKEAGIRAILNFGHTFGHGIELVGKYKEYNHGEAVALGILSASKLSLMTEDLSSECVKRIYSVFNKAGIRTTTLNEINAEDLYSAMQSDKKKEGKDLTFIVLEKIGKAKKINGLSKEMVIKAIKTSLLSY
tara:strand:+ start:11227 stop:12321 length:1095 start_codon:yes stop_codon:yes gene_type:complete